MDIFDTVGREIFKNTLSKASKPKLSDDFLERVMKGVEGINIKNEIFEKYIKRSIFFLITAVLLSIKGMAQLIYFENTFEGFANSYLPGAFEIFIYIILSLVSGLIFYQFNTLLSRRFAEMK